MKAKAFVLMAALLALSACGYIEKTPEDIQDSKKRIVLVCSDIAIVVYVDKETGVEYLVRCSGSNGCAITPLYNADGTLKTNKNYTK